MEIENKWETIDKEPEVGDLVAYEGDFTCGAIAERDLGLVLQVYNQGFEGDGLETADVMWAVDYVEPTLFHELSVVSSGSVIYDS